MPEIRKDYPIVEKHKITIEIKSLLHTRERQFNGYVIAPIKPGEYEARISVICEEYLEEKIFGIPITFIED